jgi:hypothetical protein
MSVTIVRTAWIDDDGTGTTGTVINAAWKTEMYNQIDQALAGVPMLNGNNAYTGNQTIAGLLSATGGGTHMLNASGASGQIELWTNGTRRWVIDGSGQMFGGTPSSPAACTQLVGGGGIINLGNPGTAAVNAMNFYYNGMQGFAGALVSSSTGLVLASGSDKRLKTDRGIACDTSVLERTEIHDYDWIEDGTPGRGVFSQDAHKVLPSANMPGSDERAADGRLVRPWSTDYSRYVPDLIVGWQQHAAALAAIRADLAVLKASYAAPTPEGSPSA